MDNEKIDNEKFKIMLDKLENQRMDFFERAKHSDTKLGIMITLISAVIIHHTANSILGEIFSIDWINENGIGIFVILFLIDLSIICLLYTALIFDLIAIKTKKAMNIGARLYGKSNFDVDERTLLKKAITDTEKVIIKNTENSNRKNKNCDISIILGIIGIGLIIVENIIISIVF